MNSLHILHHTNTTRTNTRPKIPVFFFGFQVSFEKLWYRKLKTCSSLIIQNYLFFRFNFISVIAFRLSLFNFFFVITSPVSRVCILRSIFIVSIHLCPRRSPYLVSSSAFSIITHSLISYFDLQSRSAHWFFSTHKRTTAIFNSFFVFFVFQKPNHGIEFQRHNIYFPVSFTWGLRGLSLPI